MGKIGLAVSPVDPDVVYATIEAGEDEHGFYRSLDRARAGRSATTTSRTAPVHTTTRRSSPRRTTSTASTRWTSSCTSPKTAAPASTTSAPGRAKHSDNHALWIDPEDPDHLLAGTDASLYETSTTAPPGASSPTCRSRSSTSWRSTTRSRSTTSSAAPRTWARSRPVAHRPRPRASATRTGTCRWVPMATASPSIPSIRTSCTWSGRSAGCSASTSSPKSSSTSSRYQPRASPPSAGTGTHRSSSARTTRAVSTSARSAYGAATTAATRGPRSRAT